MLRIIVLAATAALVVGCSAAPAATPIVIFVTPEPVVSTPAITAGPSPQATATATPSSVVPTPSAAVATETVTRTLTGTLTFLGGREGTVAYDETGCRGLAPYTAFRPGAELSVLRGGSDVVRSLLAKAPLTDPQSSPDESYSCRFSWTASVRDAAEYTFTIGTTADFPTLTSAQLDQRGWSVDLTVRAGPAAPPTLTPEPEGVDHELYAGMFERIVRDTVGVHIKGTEELTVTEDRVFVWVESRYSTVEVLKELMYELYDEIAGLTPDDWDPDVVLRMGSAYTNGWLQSSTSAADWWGIDDQLDWERVTNFERNGRL